MRAITGGSFWKSESWVWADGATYALQTHLQLESDDLLFVLIDLI